MFLGYNWTRLFVSISFSTSLPGVPAHFLERFLLMAREHEVMSVSDALEVLALWCKENIDGGDSVLMKLIKINDMEPWLGP